MNYKIMKGTALFEKLSEVKKEMDRVTARAQEVADSIGARGFARAHYSAAGGIAAFAFDKKKLPQGFRQVGNSWDDFYYPLANIKGDKDLTRRNKELLKKMADLPRVETKSVAQAVNFHFQVISGDNSLLAVHCPSIEWEDEYILVSMPKKCTYKPLADMIEITATEFKELSKEERYEKAPETN
jgi:hypothetical protein